MTATVASTGRAQAAESRPARYRPARLLSRNSRIAMWAGLWLAVAVYVVFGIVPMIGNIVISFTDYTGLPGASVHNVGFTNYSQMFSTQAPGLEQGITATVIFVVAVTLGQNIVALLFAHKLVGSSRLAAIGRTLVFLPIALGVTVVGLVWILIFNPATGPMASFFGLFGVHSAFFGADGWALTLVILVQIWMNTGFTTLVFIGGLRSIDPALYEAASIDGAGGWQRLRRITYPMLAPSVTANVMLALVGSFTMYNLIYVLTDGKYGTQTLGMLSFNVAFGSFEADLGYGAAVSVLLFVLTLIVSMPLLIALRRRERKLLT